MSSKLKDEILKLDIVVNGNKAQKELYKLDEANASIAKTQKELRSEKIKLLAAGKKESAQYKLVTDQIKENNKTVGVNKARMHDLRKEIGVTALTSKQLTAYQKELRFALSNAIPNGKKAKEYTKELQKTNTQVLKLKQNSVGTSGVVNKLKGSIGSAGTTLVGLAGIGSIAALGKQALDTVNQFRELKLETKQLTSLQGNLLSNAVATTKALSDTFGTDYQANLLAANSLTSAYGVTYGRAMDVIEKGYLSGANASGDMLGQIEEYAPLMKEAKISMEGVVALMAQANQSGVINDKGLDSLKEGLLSIRNPTEATKEALTGLGIDVKKTYADLQSGSTTYFEVMQKVSGKLSELSDQSPEVGAAIADIFKGAGEDASLEYLKSLEDVTLELDSLIDSSDELIQLKKTEASVNVQLNESWLKLSSAGGALNKVYVSMKQGLANILTSINDTYDASARMKEVTGRSFWGSMFSGDYTKLGDFTIDLTNARKEAEKLEDPLTGLKNHLTDIDDLLSKEKGNTAFSKDKIKILKDEAKQASIVIDSINKSNQSKQEQALKTRASLERRAAELKIQTSIGMSNSEIQTLITTENKKLTTEKEFRKTAIEKAEKENVARLKKLADFEANYYKQQKISLAKSNEDKAILNKQAAIKEAEDLGAKQELLDQIKADHNLKIKEAKSVDEQEELDRIAAFEAKKTELENEIALSKKETDLEKELLKEEQNIEKEQLALESLKLTTEERNKLELILEESKEIALQEIRDKHSKLGLKKETEIANAKKKLHLDIVNGAIALAGQESRVGQALLAVKGILASKEIMIQLGLLKTKTAIAGAESSTAVATGWAKTLAAGFPQNVPLMLAFGAQAIGVVSAIKGAAGMADRIPQPIPGFEKGYGLDKHPITRTDGKVFNSKIGGAATTQMVTDPTYFPGANFLAGEVMPEIIIDGPTTKELRPEVKDEIFATHRRVRGYETGTLTSGNTKHTDGTRPIETDVSNNESHLELVTVLKDLNTSLITLKAKLVFGYDDLAELDKMKDKVANSSNNGTLAS